MMPLKPWFDCVQDHGVLRTNNEISSHYEVPGVRIPGHQNVCSKSPVSEPIDTHYSIPFDISPCALAGSGLSDIG